MRQVARAALLASACSDRSGATPQEDAPHCVRAFAEKLGTPFVRVCAGQLGGVVTESYWIAMSPIACPAGPHETIPCPPTVALGPLGDRSSIPSRPIQLVDAAAAHRTCTLRFGGRLPTVRERAMAQGALGITTLLVTATSAGGYHLDVVPEWTTVTTCPNPATIDRCAARRFPTGIGSEIAWAKLRACVAVPAPIEGASRIGPGESCQGGGTPTCVVVADASAPKQGFTISCRPLADEEMVHPPSSWNLAGFRCVVPESALAGTIK